MSENKSIPYYHSHFLNYYKENNDINKILDPISTIVRLAMLHYKNEGTKITVDDNKVVFNETSTWIIGNLFNYQGIYRNINGYSRQDLVLVYPPIFRAMLWYDKNKEIELEHIRKILVLTSKGLLSLKELYKDEDGRMEMFLNHCIEKIKQYMTNEIEIDDLDNKIILDEKINPRLFDTIKMLWSSKEIEIISDTLCSIEDHLIKHDTLECQAVNKYIKMIMRILEEKDKAFKNMIVFNKVSNTVGAHSTYA